jgi:hypothetical protein
VFGNLPSCVRPQPLLRHREPHKSPVRGLFDPLGGAFLKLADKPLEVVISARSYQPPVASAACLAFIVVYVHPSVVRMAPHQSLTNHA